MFQIVNYSKAEKGFACHNRDGNAFRITFNNGYSVSLRWGVDNYCENYGKETKEFLKSKDTEIAVFNPRGEFVELAEYDDVLENQSPEQVAEIIFKYSRM